MKVFVCIFLLLAFAVVQKTTAKKTAKEWAEFNRKRLHQLDEEERKEMTKSLGNDVPIEKPGMVFATFGPEYTKKEKDILAQKFSGQLMSAGVRVSIFETGENQWVLATFRTFDTIEVVKYLRQQSEVMKTTIDTTDHWNLPKYQKEFEKDRIKKQKEEREKAAKEEARKAKEEAERKAKEAAAAANSIDLDAKEL